jgi:hypothetical protein
MAIRMFHGFVSSPGEVQIFRVATVPPGEENNVSVNNDTPKWSNEILT